jgi:hypothetical protein
MHGASNPRKANAFHVTSRQSRRDETPNPRNGGDHLSVFVEVNGFDAPCIKSAKGQRIPHDRQSEAVITKDEPAKIFGAHFKMPVAGSGSTGRGDPLRAARPWHRARSRIRPDRRRTAGTREPRDGGSVISRAKPEPVRIGFSAAFPARSG